MTDLSPTGAKILRGNEQGRVDGHGAALDKLVADLLVVRNPDGTKTMTPKGFQALAALEAKAAGPATAPADPAPRVVVVGCSAGKQQSNQPIAVSDLYTGSLHWACRRAAQALTRADGRVLVLSGLHGLLELDARITPYEHQLGAPGSATADQLREQAAALGIEQASVTVLAPSAYAELVAQVWPEAEQPLAGLGGIGAMRRVLAQIAATGTVPDRGTKDPARAGR
ncbi:DUF6884 domain-containing protein [Kitasatospora sp. NPDC001261]|uniref:DUF6884 domain-containing protein n=1 Tax=Kitasatospora sp. NPDC001261 TaxID=3364012 RepID=UPI00367A7FC9